MTEDLARRLEEAESTLAAIRSGEIDAVIVDGPQGVQVYTLEGADAFYRALIEQMPEGAAAVALDGTILYANETLADMLGLPLESVIGADLTGFPASDEDRVNLTGLLRGTGERAGDVCMKAPSGARVDVGLAITPVDDETLCVLLVDLTQRKADESALRTAEERFRGAFDNAPIGMALLDPDGSVLRANDALATIVGQPVEHLLGGALPWLEDGDLDLDARSVAAVERNGARPDGRLVWADIHLSAIRAGDRTIRQFIAQVQDITERREHEHRLQHVADHDNLTGLLNRRGFEAALVAHQAMTARYGPHIPPGALILLDVDHFKYINDARGHQVGDRVLMAVSEALRSRLRDSDVLARLGGDEFAILLPRGDARTARVVADQIITTAREVQIAELVGLRRLTVSAGVAEFEEGASPGEALGRADLAMYDAKEAGRDGYAVYDPKAGEASGTEHRMTWLRRIREALDTDTLMVHAQPITSLADGSLVSRELLVRIPGTDGTPVAAGVWFEVAERYDLATAIDEWMLAKAFELLAEDDDSGGLNVNVSATSIGRDRLLACLREGLARTGVPGHRLTLEITETAAIGNIAAAARFAEEVHALGCRLALDDFGAGFGSFYYLKHLPFDDVKIDGEFVRGCVRDTRDQAIIRAMVDVAGSMGRRTVAESIEDAETLELLRERGVDLAQGYFLGRPEPVSLPSAESGRRVA